MVHGFNIDKIALLARLNLSGEEKSVLARDIEKILGYVGELSKLDTKNIEPTSHVLPMENVFREDERKASRVRDDVLAHAPEREGHFFKVPKVIDQ